MQEQIPHYKTHICFVSDQTMPNLLLCLDPVLKPEKVILLTSQDMIAKGVYGTLADNFKKLGVKVEKEILQDISFPALTAFIKNFVEGLFSLNIEDLAFNITGGTKLMTIAAYSACNGLLPMFYVDTYNNKLFLLDEKKEFTIGNLCTVVNILNNYGYRRIKKEEKKQGNGKIISTLLKNEKYLISCLNAMAISAEKNLTAVNSNASYAFETLLKECEQAGLLSYSNNTVFFKDEYCRSFCNGIWLEEHVAYTLEQLKNKNHIADYEGSVNVIYNDSTVSNEEAKAVNELDALFVRNNILHLIECKTSKMNVDEKTRSIFYKLDSLHSKIGGVFAKGILISVFELTPEEKEHAQKNNIIVIDEIDKIRNLQQTFIDIFNKKSKK